MNKTQLILVAFTLLVRPALVGAAPTPGCADFSSPGTWSQGQSEYGDSWSELALGDGLTYQLRDSRVFLTNAPGSFWFSPGDTNVSFEYPLGSMAVDVRRPSDPSTNVGNLEVEVSAHGGPFVFLASFAGIPDVTNVPPDPACGCSGYTITTVPLSWGRICLSSNLDNPSLPLTIRSILSDSPQVELSWTPSNKGLCQLQWCRDLEGGAWTDWGTARVGTGTDVRALDPVEPGTPQRFYRVLQFP